jgi:hypothetical protein
LLAHDKYIMGKSKYDWAELQAYYDKGNSWRAVTAQFGVYNLSIQKAVKRGDLVSRDRADAVRLATGGSLPEQGKCIYCEADFEYRPAQQTGKYCSNTCRAKYQREIETPQRVLEGVASDRAVRSYLIEKDNRCSICEINEWHGQPLNLQMDHIDGNCDNNTLDNCRLLCPNCHSLTDTFGRKNHGKFVTRRSQINARRHINKI